MPVIDSDSHLHTQIEMAARGCFSGTLVEWPHLKSALRHYGYSLPDSTRADKVRDVCQQILADEASDE